MDDMEQTRRSDQPSDQPSGPPDGQGRRGRWAHRVIGLRAAAAVAVASLILGGAGGAVLGAVSTGGAGDVGPAGGQNGGQNGGPGRGPGGGFQQGQLPQGQLPQSQLPGGPAGSRPGQQGGSDSTT